MPRTTGFDRIGKEVLAKWPGSQLYYPGKILDFDNDNKVFKVQFEENDEPVEVLQRYVTSIKNAKTWRSRSSSPARSPVRVRRRSRSKSPSRARRVTRSPSRRKTSGSPRATAVRKAKESPSPVQKEPPVVHSTPEKIIEPVNASVEVQSSQTKHSAEISEEKSFVVTRRVTRSVARLQETERTEESTTTSIQQDEPEQKVGWRGQIEALIGIFVFPAILLALCFVCGDKNQAFSFTKWPKIPHCSSFLDWRVFLAVGTWFDVQFLSTLLPLGEVMKGQETKDGKTLDYRINGLFLLLINVAVMGILMYTKHAFQLAALVDEYYLQISTSCLLVAFVTGILVMIMARWDDSVKDKGFSPHGFLVGKILHPRFLKIDFKMASTKASLMLWAWLNLCFLLNQYRSLKVINYPTLLVFVGQFIYLGYGVAFEKLVIRSRDITKEKYGFAMTFMTMALFPFFYSMQLLYVSKMAPNLTRLHLGVFIAFQVIGFLIYHQSNVEKQEFRSDPKKAMKKGVKVIFTSDGRNLLADGWWGRLRHPNYLGDILIAVSWGIPSCSYGHVIPWLYPIFLTVLLVYRAIEDEAYCSKRYGLSWQEYKTRAKYVIFPYVY